MHATYFGTVAARAAELNSGMLGEIIGLSRRDPGRRVAYINPWLARGELVQVVHRLDRDDRGSATAVVMLTVAVGQSRAEMTSSSMPTTWSICSRSRDGWAALCANTFSWQDDRADTADPQFTPSPTE